MAFTFSLPWLWFPFFINHPQEQQQYHTNLTSTSKIRPSFFSVKSAASATGLVSLYTSALGASRQ
jgi:hypothetical protein